MKRFRGHHSLLQFGAYAALGLGGLGIGFLISLLGTMVSSSRAKSSESDQATRTYYINAKLPFAAEPTLSPAIKAVEMVKCPCGLELPASSMRDHVTISGHSKPAIFGPGGTGKVWDLNEPVVETTSPDCYRCGKPVYGLKRMGKTIYVAHLGCADKTKARSDVQDTARASKQEPTNRQPRSRKCPLCRKTVTAEDAFVQMRSRTGRTIDFHVVCVELVK